MQKLALSLLGATGLAAAREEGDVGFSAFIQQHGRAYAAGSEEYRTRLARFMEHSAAVEAHNARTDRLWTAGVNMLADRTPEELAMLRGYRRTGPSSGGSRTSSMSLAGISVHAANVSHLPTNFTWKGHLKAMVDVRDQGACGSCWAVSSATVLQAHAELYQRERSFSAQQIVECTPNPNACGGAGGCKGATAELAMQYVVDAGLATEEEHEYLGTDSKCSDNIGGKSSAKQGIFLAGAARGGAAFGLTSWHKLPENKAEPLLLAVYEKGPVVVSVAATASWSMYNSGVMEACEKDAVINHAVVLTGYGKEGEHSFWQIQNSWGKLWGEDGFIRVLRHDHREEGSYCGWDSKPEDGTACRGGPKKVWICGSCGILYDSVVPVFVESQDGFMARHTRDVNGIFAELTA